MRFLNQFFSPRSIYHCATTGQMIMIIWKSDCGPERVKFDYFYKRKNWIWLLPNQNYHIVTPHELCAWAEYVTKKLNRKTENIESGV